jgi:hypothetical protein
MMGTAIQISEPVQTTKPRDERVLHSMMQDAKLAGVRKKTKRRSISLSSIPEEESLLFRLIEATQSQDDNYEMDTVDTTEDDDTSVVAARLKWDMERSTMKERELTQKAHVEEFLKKHYHVQQTASQKKELRTADVRTTTYCVPAVQLSLAKREEDQNHVGTFFSQRSLSESVNTRSEINLPARDCAEAKATDTVVTTVEASPLVNSGAQNHPPLVLLASTNCNSTTNCISSDEQETLSGRGKEKVHAPNESSQYTIIDIDIDHEGLQRKYSRLLHKYKHSKAETLRLKREVQTLTVDKHEQSTTKVVLQQREDDMAELAKSHHQNQSTTELEWEQQQRTVCCEELVTRFQKNYANLKQEHARVKTHLDQVQKEEQALKVENLRLWSENNEKQTKIETSTSHSTDEHQAYDQTLYIKALHEVFRLKEQLWLQQEQSRKTIMIPSTSSRSGHAHEGCSHNSGTSSHQQTKSKTGTLFHKKSVLQVHPKGSSYFEKKFLL